MTTALASAGLADRPVAFRLVFCSIGTASPSDAASIALGLKVPVSVAMDAIYRAPSVLVDGLTENVGKQMTALLSELGCKVSLDPMDAPQIDAAKLFDVSLYVSDTSRYGEVCRALAAFLGTQPEEAGRLISTPPGIILGKVSSATIDALRDRLGDGVELIASDPENALYDVFLAPCDAVVKARFLQDIRRRGFDPLAEDGCILAGLNKADADTLWSMHQFIKELRVVNRDFLRFDLVLTGGAPSEASYRALTEVADVPPHIAPRLFGENEITVVEAISNPEMNDCLEKLIDAGLEIRADLVTFLHLGLEIVKVPNTRAVADTLGAIGIEASETALRRLPFRLPYHMPELQARMVREMLEASGAWVEFVDWPDAESTT